MGLAVVSGAVTSLCKVKCKCNADLVLVGAGCHYLVQSHLSVKSSVSVMPTLFWLGLAVVSGAVTPLCKVKCKCNADLVLVGAGCSCLVESHLFVKSSVSVMQTWWDWQ